MDSVLRRRLDAVLVLLAIIAAGVLGVALDRGAFDDAAFVFLAGALVAQVARSVGLFPASGSET